MEKRFLHGMLMISIQAVERRWKSRPTCYIRIPLPLPFKLLPFKAVKKDDWLFETRKFHVHAIF